MGAVTALTARSAYGASATETGALARFREQPSALLACFGGAIVVQALLVFFYFTVVQALALSVGLWDLAVIVPISFLVQMLQMMMSRWKSH